MKTQLTSPAVKSLSKQAHAQTRRWRLDPRVMLLLLGTALTGCSTTGYDRGDAAGRSLRDAAVEVQRQSRDLTVTMASLDNLVTKPAGDLKPQFKRFSTSLDRLAASAKRNEHAAEAALSRNAEYLANWDRNLTNMNYEVVRTRSETRRAEVTDRFETVSRRYAEARTVMLPLLVYLNDIRLALSSDLTFGGLEAIKPIVTNATENAGKVQLALTRLTNELTDSGARMSSYQFPNAFGQPTNVAAH